MDLECNDCFAHAELKDVQAFVHALSFNVREDCCVVLHIIAICFEVALWVHVLDCYVCLLKVQLFKLLLEGQRVFKGVLFKLDGFVLKCCLD
jgi:hypothetical protein